MIQLRWNCLAPSKPMCIVCLLCSLSNMRNFHGRLITPGHRTVSSIGEVTHKDDGGGMDWMEAGRYRSVTTMWTEDWVKRTHSSLMLD